MKIWKATEYIYRVQSDSSDRVYIVDITDSKPSCTCVAFAIKRNKTGTGTCKHIDRVLEVAKQETIDELSRIKAEEESKAAASTLRDIFENLKGGD